MAGKFVPFKKGDAPGKGKPGDKGKEKFPFPPAKKKAKC